MGFFSWKCCKTNVSIPYDYKGDIIIITPKKSYRGVYNGYGRINTAEGEINIMPQVGLDTGILKAGEDMWHDGWTVIDKDGKEYSMGKDFKNFAHAIVDRETGEYLFEGKDVNELGRLETVKRKVSLYDKIKKEIRIVVGYSYNGVQDTFDTLKHSEDCPHQGFFYPEEYINFPTDYRGERYE